MSTHGIPLFCISCEVIQIRTDAKRPPISASPSSSIALVPEPCNPYDRNAIVVTSNATKMGYIPRRIAQSLRPMLTDCHHVAWSVKLNASDAAAVADSDDVDDGYGARDIIDISASFVAADHHLMLPLLRMQADAVVAAAALRRLSPVEMHSKFMRESLLLLAELHSSQGNHCIMSHQHAELIRKILAQDDEAISILSRLLQRRALWVQVSALKLEPSCASMSLSSLISIGAITSSSQRMPPELALSLLPSLPLHMLTKLSRTINAKQSTSKRELLREIQNAACKQRTLFGGPMDLASAIVRCLSGVSPFICVLPCTRRLCGRAASFMFLGVAAPAAVTSVVATEYDEVLDDDASEVNSSKCSLAHAHTGCLPWFKLLPMIEMGLVDRPCDALMFCTPLPTPPQAFIANVLSDLEMSDCEFAKDCLDAALCLGGKPATSNGLQSRNGCALAILLSCAARGIREYLLRHDCISRLSPSAQLLSCVLELIPPPPANFPCALPISADAHAVMPLSKALAAAAITSSQSCAHPDVVSFEATSAAVRALTMIDASHVDNPVLALQKLAHLQPQYIARFSSIYVYCKTLHALCPSLETQGMHSLACIAYVILLSLPFLHHRRVHWWTRLCINAENSRFSNVIAVTSSSAECSDPWRHTLMRICHGCPSTPLCDAVLLCALRDDMVCQEDMHCLAKRAQRSIDGSSCCEISKQLISAAVARLNLPALMSAPETIIEGRPSNRIAGQKSHFIGFDDSVGASVEEFALQWCGPLVSLSLFYFL
jgi:hypothetical protein